jgi:alanine racemase
VDASALRANLRALRARAPDSRVLAVVKANAYGHGLVSTARALPEADGFAVARLDEAIHLRQAGIRQPLVLLEGVFDAEQLAEAAYWHLELVVHEAQQLELLEQWRGTHRFTLWLKVDTGMNRLGFRTDQFADAWLRLNSLQSPAATLRVLTHLACADEPANPMSGEQLARFWPLVKDLDAELSIANSAALLRLPETHVQWVRPGLALYGVSPLESMTGAELGLVPAMTLESTVIAIRQVKRGETVGYGARWRAGRDSMVAILAAGYGDGLPRSLPDETPVQIGTRRAPLVGRVSMDMIAVDITGLPGVAVGEPVELWGKSLPVELVAQKAGTIPYELLCGVSQRVPVELV